MTRATIAPLVLMLGVGLSLVLVNDFRRTAERDDALEFERLAQRTRATLHDRVNIYAYGLRGARGVFAASDEVTRDEFRAYAASRQPAIEFPGALGIGFIRRVARERVPELVADRRAHGLPDFEVMGDNVGPDRYIIDYLEPLDMNRAALGFDIASEPKRREACERAMRTGLPSLTAAITLRQATGEGPGFMYLLAVYRPGAPVATESERERALIGWIYMPIVMRRAVAGVTDLSYGQVDFDVFDGPLEDEVLLYDHNDDLVSGAPVEAAYARRDHVLVEPIEVGGRHWTIVTSSTASFVRASRLPMALVGGFGVLLSLLLFVMLRSYSRSMARAERLAAQMTADLRSKSEALERMSLHDGLTGLPNRALIYDRVQQAIAFARREPERFYALMFVDLDDFKHVNDTYGHRSGDALLRTIAERLRLGTRGTDTVGLVHGRLHDDSGNTVGRLGGDEFVVLLRGLARREDAGVVAARIVTTLAQPMPMGDTHISVRASIGIVIGEPRHATPEDLVHDADAAMYQAKARGKGHWVIFGAAGDGVDPTVATLTA